MLDRTGFRKIFRTTDHLVTQKLISQKKKRTENRHVGGSDTLHKKPFDSLQHDALWKTLSENMRSVNSTCASSKIFTVQRAQTTNMATP